jgi:hypothetical protein
MGLSVAETPQTLSPNDYKLYGTLWGAWMGNIRTHLLATAALVALSTSVYAADMGMPLKAPPPPPPPVQDWSGVYVGIEGGYGWGKQTINPAFDPFELSDPWF